MNTKVSVIIPAHNEERHLTNAIKSISDQSYRNIELIVINDASTDTTEESYNTAMNTYDFNGGRTARYTEEKCGSAAKTRNTGVKYATGEILIFHDADCVAHPEMVKNVVKDIELGFDGVATKTDVVDPETLIEQAIRVERSISWEMNQEKAVEIKKGAPVLVANMTKKAFNKLGGFNENIFYFEDQDLTNRFFEAGFKAIFDPTVKEYHNDPSTLREQIDQSLQNGKGLRTILKHGRFNKLIIPLYPLVFLIGVLLLFLGNIIVGVILISPMFLLYIILLKNSNDLFGVITFLPLFLIRNVFKLIGLIKG